MSISNYSGYENIGKVEQGIQMFSRVFVCSSSKLKEKLSVLAIHIICLVFLLGAAYGILGESSYPGTQIFAIVTLAIASYIGGAIVTFLGLPALLGMLVVGILFRNISAIPYYKNISIEWGANLRDLALAIILLKAGLGLDPQKLMQLKVDVIKLSFIPCIAEIIGSATVVHYLLGLPWLWAFMLGSLVSAVSAAVVVPGVLNLEERDLGVESGIPTLLMASVSIDNIIALTGFLITFSIVTSEDNLMWTLIARPLEPFIGFVSGAIIGVFLWYLPYGSSSKKSLVFYRVTLLFLGCLSFVFVSKRIGMAGAGALGCVSLAFISSLRWRSDPEEFISMTWITGILWSLIEPFLFGLIGAEVTIESLQTNLGITVVALLLGILVRVLATVLALMRSKLSFKETIFISTVWLSKATVQAAVGSQALDYSRTHTTESQFGDYSKQVLTMAVVSIILTAPVGAAVIEHLAPFLLRQSGYTSDSSTTSSEEEQERIAEVTVTNYGARRCASAGEIAGLIKGLKSNINEI